MVEDCGLPVNPAIVEGQIRGGVAQAIGAVLLEHAAYDEDGQFLASTFMDYLLPTTTNVPNIEIHHVEHDPHRPRRELPRRGRGRHDRRPGRHRRTPSRTRSRRSACAVQRAAPAAVRGSSSSSGTVPVVKPAPFEYHAPRTARRGARRCSPSTATRPRCSPAARAWCRCWRCAWPGPSQLVDINDVADAGRHPPDRRRRRRVRRADPRARRRALAAGRRAAPGAGRGAAARSATCRSATAAPSAGQLAHADAVGRAARRGAWSPTPRSSSASAAAASASSRPTTSSSATSPRRSTTTSCLTEVRIRPGRRGAGWAFQEIARRHGDFALVGVAAMVALDRRRRHRRRPDRASSGVADRPVRAAARRGALVGQPRDRRHDRSRRRTTPSADLDPASDIHGSAEYRRHLAGVAVRRALTDRRQRAQEGVT